jgi:hypothetical protein
MDAFESIVATLLQEPHETYGGFWVRTSVRVELTQEERRRRCAPRTEIDIVAFHPQRNELWVVECKSFLNSAGVKVDAFHDLKPNSRYKLFVDEEYWEVVKRKLLQDLGFSALNANVSPTVRLCLAAGKIAQGHEEPLRGHFEKMGWMLLAPTELAEGLMRLRDSRYRNDVATMAVKLLRSELKET